LETFCITAFSVLLSWPLLILIQTVLASYIPDQLKLYPDPWGVSLFLATLTITITLISSGYPILLTNKVKIVEVIKISNAQSLKFGNLSFRKMLIIFQFLIAQLFVISTCIIGLQLKHALQNNSGFDKDAIITLRFPSKSYQDSNVDPFVFKQAIKHITGVEQASLGHLPMSNDHWGNALFAKSDTGQVQADVQMKFVDQDNFKLYNFKMLAGRPLQLADTSTGIVLNLASVQKLGFKSAENARTIVKAFGSPFETKDKLKARGYRWDAEARVWYTAVKSAEALEAEAEWLKAQVYGGRSARIGLEIQDSRVQFSSRSGKSGDRVL
jgi:hypothetical protein